MSRIVFDNGKEVELSKETENRLREALLPKHEKKVIYHLAIMKSPDDVNSWRSWHIFSGTNKAIKNWDGNLGKECGDEYSCAAYNYSRDEMKEIAETILEMIGK